MAFQPDILVTSSDGITLVVEAKVSMPDFKRTEEELKQYMVGMQCPVGILITPERMWMYRDFYVTRSPQSVQRVGDFNVQDLWQQPPPMQGAPFEVFVQHWLEGLSLPPYRELPKELSEALRENVLPAVASGDVRAAHPRYA